MTVFHRIEEAKRRAEVAIRTNDLSGKENAGLMADVAIDAALPVLLGPDEEEGTDALVCQSCKRPYSEAELHRLCPCGSEDFYNEQYFNQRSEKTS